MVTNRTLLQETCDPPYLGRLMSAYMMMFGLTQLGTIPVGAFADGFGVPRTITILGSLFALTTALIWLAKPQIRRLE
jgi:MFS family permease